MLSILVVRGDQQVRVTFAGFDTLDRALARAAVEIAFGASDAPTTVWATAADGPWVGYRVYRGGKLRSMRKVWAF